VKARGTKVGPSKIKCKVSVGAYPEVLRLKIQKACEIQNNVDHVCDQCLDSGLYCIWLDLNMRQKVCNWCLLEKLMCTVERECAAGKKECMVKKRTCTVGLEKRGPKPVKNAQQLEVESKLENVRSEQEVLNPRAWSLWDFQQQ